jgi:DNA-binding PadR family transcriptional regulator
MDGLNPELMRGSLELMVLSVLSDSSKYGYLIQQSLRDASDELVDLKAGTLYPILHKLETKKLVRSRWDDSTGRRRKWYDLTAAGKKQLKVRVDEWQAYVDCLRQVLGPLVDPTPQPA